MTSSRILIVEDDVDVAELLATELRRAGLTVECQHTAVQGLIAARERPPEAVILDLGLPDFDGHLVLSRLRATTHVPVVMLTARDTLAEKLEMLSLGASDYIVKPFEPSEVVARIHVQLRRTPSEVIAVGDLILYPARQQATYTGRDLALTRIQYGLLALLAQEPGHVYAARDLCAALWDEQPRSSNLLRMHIGHLRRKLQAAGGTDVVRTIWGAGYALVTAVTPQ